MLVQPEADRKETRKKIRGQLWKIYGFLILAAIGITAYQFYYQTYVAPKKPLKWLEISFENMKGAVENERPVLLGFGEAEKLKPLQDSFETESIRTRIYQLGLIPIQQEGAKEDAAKALAEDWFREQFKAEPMDSVVIFFAKDRYVVLTDAAGETEILKHFKDLDSQ